MQTGTEGTETRPVVYSAKEKFAALEIPALDGAVSTPIRPNEAKPYQMARGGNPASHFSLGKTPPTTPPPITLGAYRAAGAPGYPRESRHVHPEDAPGGGGEPAGLMLVPTPEHTG